MPVIIAAAAIAAAASLIGAAIASGDQAKAQAIRDDIAKKIGAIKLPILDRLVASKLSPEDAARWMAQTQSSKAQGDVLGKLMETVNEKGETVEDRAAYLRMQQEAGGIANSSLAAVNRGMAVRGLGGSGMAFALQQQGGQAAANRANQMGVQAAADARGRYMEALGLAGNVSGQMRGQDQTAMQAQDNINMFNARQQSDADRYNANIAQQNFDNEMSKANAEAGALNGTANSYERSANNTNQTAGNLSNSIITAGATYDQYGNPIKKKPDYNTTAGGA